MRRTMLSSSPAGTAPRLPSENPQGGNNMPTVKELTIQLENKPGTLAKLCNALANRKVNIVAFQASTAERRSQIHLIVDNLTAGKTALGAEGLIYTENDVAQIALSNRPGELS